MQEIVNIKNKLHYYIFAIENWNKNDIYNSLKIEIINPLGYCNAGGMGCWGSWGSGLAWRRWK